MARQAHRQACARAMCGTEPAYQVAASEARTELRATKKVRPYAVCGTATAYGATEIAYGARVWGTDLAYGARVCGTELAYRATTEIAVWGTELAYRATTEVAYGAGVWGAEVAYGSRVWGTELAYRATTEI
eukprot:65241-Rhodomonas_salina.1